MSKESVTPGKTTVAPEVLVAIARMATLEVPGVYALCPVPGGVNRLFKRGADEGVRLQITDDVVDVDLYLILEHDVNLRQVSREVQKAVARALGEMVGMTVGHVNVHIEDIHYPNNGNKTPTPAS